MNSQQSNQVYAMALLAVVRKLVKNLDNSDNDTALEAAISGLRSEVRNMLIEHLSPEEIAELAAGNLCASIGHTLRDLAEISMALTGKINIEGLISSTEKICSKHLGREVKVVE